MVSMQSYVAQNIEAQVLDNKTTTQTTLKWCHRFGSIARPKTRDSITAVSIRMAGTAKNTLNNICKEMEYAEQQGSSGTRWYGRQGIHGESLGQ